MIVKNIFWENVKKNVDVLLSSIESTINLHLVFGKTQIGKQAAIIKSIMQLWFTANLYPSGEKEMLIAMDWGLVSDKNVQKQKENRWDVQMHESFSHDSRTEQSTPLTKSLLTCNGHHNDLEKFLRPENYDIRCLDMKLNGRDVTFSLRDFVTLLENQSLKKKFLIFADEAHQYKHVDGPIHIFLRDVIGIDLSTGKHPHDECNVVFVSATPYDMSSHIREQSEYCDPEVWASLYWGEPSNYCGLDDLIINDRLDDYEAHKRRVLNTNLERYDGFDKDNEKEILLHHDTILSILRKIKPHAQKSSAQLIVVRQPSNGDAATALTSAVKKQFDKDFGILVCTQKNKKDIEKFEKLLKERQDNDDISNFLLSIDYDMPGLMNKNYIVLIQNKYSIGESIPMDNVSFWIEPYKNQTHSTYCQQVGRTCGPDKLECSHVLIADRRKIQQIIEAQNQFINSGEIKGLSELSSHQHKLDLTRSKGEYDVLLVERSNPLFEDHFSRGDIHNTVKRPYNLSNRAKKNKLNHTPDELILSAIEQQITMGLTAFPLAHGGEYNCKYNGVEAYAIYIDAPSPNCPPDLKEEIKNHIGKYFIQMPTGHVVREVQGTSISRLPKSKKKSQMFSEYSPLKPTL